MSQRYLITVQLLGHLEQHLPSLPRAKKTMGMTRIATLVERGLSNMQRDIQSCSILLQIGLIVLVGDIGHSHKGRFYLKAGHEHTRTLGQEFQKRQRVLSPRQSYEHLVTIVNESVVS